jgi:adenylyl- and sulfurtransferase ThiI
MRTTPDNIQRLADIVGAQARSRVLEAEKQVSEAITLAIKDGQEAEKPAGTLPLAIKRGLGTDNVEVTLTVGIKHKFSKTVALDDVQLGLEME